MIGIEHYLTVAAALFVIGIFGIFTSSIPVVGTTFSPLVQLVERRTVNPYVAGSSPAGGATFKFKLCNKLE